VSWTVENSGDTLKQKVDMIETYKVLSGINEIFILFV